MGGYMKSDKEKKWQENSKMINDPNRKIFDNDDIYNLNDGEFAPIEEKEEKIPLTEEEKKEVRKKLFILLVLIGIALIILVIILIFNPFGGDEKMDKEPEKPIVEENDIDYDEVAIKDLEDGQIPNTNKELKQLLNENIYRVADSYGYDIIAIYKNDKNVIDKLSDQNKLLLLTKTQDFKDLFKEKIKDVDICSSNIKITNLEINDILNRKFHTSLSKYENFIYYYYEDSEFKASVNFTWQKDGYIVKCFNGQSDVKQLVEQSYVSATKEDDDLYIDIKVVFINKNGIYKDSNFKTLITKLDQTNDNTNYMSSANTYRYTYKWADTGYYLTEIDLLK